LFISFNLKVPIPPSFPLPPSAPPSVILAQPPPNTFCGPPCPVNILFKLEIYCGN